MGKQDDHIPFEGQADAVEGPEPEHRVMIVCGAHLDAERWDRPLAYALRERVRAWAAAWRAETGAPGATLEPVVCSDLWYLNHHELRTLPTIAVGHPGVNALTAHLVGRLPNAYAVEDRLAVQMDPELASLVAACWGVDADATREAIDAFAARHLDPFCQAACAEVALRA